MLSLFKFFLGALGPRRGRQWLWISVLVVFTSFVELAALGLLALFITSLTSLDQVMLSRYVVYGKQLLGERLFTDHNLFYLVLGVLTICLVLLKNLLTCVHNYVTARFEGGMSMDAGMKMLKGFLDAPYVWSSKQNSSDVQTLLQWRSFVGYFPGHLMVMFSDAVITVLLFSSLFFFEPLVSLAVLVLLGCIGGGVFMLCRNRIAFYGSSAKNLNLFNARESLRNIQGLREVKSFGAIKNSLNSFEEHLDKYARCTARQRVFERAAVWSLESFGIAGIIAGSIFMIQSSDYSSARMMGTLSLAAVAAWRILPSLSRTVSILGTVRGYMPYLVRVKDFLEELEGFRVDEDCPAEELPLLTRQIELDGVDYTYEGASRKALSNVTVSIRRGEMVGVVGHSGAGKSTLVDVLVGFVQPTNGSVRVDGKALVDSTAGSWRNQLGLVSQSPYFFDGSLEENIAMVFGCEAIDTKQVFESCRLAGLEDYIAGMPDGLQSMMGERGALLSGGQAQRIAIARALYRNPRVLIFDEATSSLDDQNERLIRDTILGLKGDRTVIIIAHRMRTVEECDRLIWIERGGVVKVGTPDVILPMYIESKVDRVDEFEDGEPHEK